MAFIRRVAGDNLPGLDITLVEEDAEGNEVPIDLSDPDTTIVMYLRKKGSPDVLTIPFTKTDGGAGEISIEEFPDEAFPVRGNYEGEIEIDFNGAKQTLHQVLQFNVRAQFA